MDMPVCIWMRNTVAQGRKIKSIRQACHRSLETPITETDCRNITGEKKIRSEKQLKKKTLPERVLIIVFHSRWFKMRLLYDAFC